MLCALSIVPPGESFPDLAVLEQGIPVIESNGHSLPSPTPIVLNKHSLKIIQGIEEILQYRFGDFSFQLLVLEATIHASYTYEEGTYY